MVMRTITNIISHAIDYDLARDDEKEMEKVVPRKPRFAFNAFSLFDDDKNDSDEDKEDKKDDEDADKQQSEEHKLDKDELLIHMLFKTELINVIVNACMKQNLTEYSGSGNRIEIGYVPHLSRLAKMISKVCGKNEITKSELESEFPDWAEFESTVLQPRIQVREGQLCEDKDDKPKRSFSFGEDNDDDDDDDLNHEPLQPLQFNRPDDYGGTLDDQRTNQAEMDRLMKPCLDFEDDDEDENGETDNALKISDLEKDPLESFGNTITKNKKNESQSNEFSMDKYFSNDNVERTKAQGMDFNDDDEEEEVDDGYGSRGKKATSALPSRYLDDYGSEEKDNKSGKQEYSIEELDGWMNQVNEKMKQVEEAEAKVVPVKKDSWHPAEDLGSKDDDDDDE